MAQTNGDTPTYDIVIIGAGTSGCVVANRLSEDPSISVLVLEAGLDRSHDERVYTPGLATQLYRNDDYDWQYVSEPQPGINGRTMNHPRGKVVGGTSAINSFALIYPNKAGLDVWQDLGNEGWGWDGVKDYFRKFQTVRQPNDEVARELRVVHGAETQHQANGPIQASFPLTATATHKAWLEAFRGLGLENLKDPLDGDALGGHIATCHISNEKRERSHAGVAYLEPVLSRKNLHVVTGALVQKLLFHQPVGDDVTATGVEYIQDGISRQVYASKEVILAAGAFESPHLLELSGFGSKELLERIQIDCIYDNPNIGENLQDHIRPGLSSEAADWCKPSKAMPVAEAKKLYEETRTGPLAEQTCHTFAYMPVNHFTSSEDQAILAKTLDEHLNKSDLSPFERKRNDFIRKMILSPDEATATAFLSRQPPAFDPDGVDRISLQAMLSHPFSRGSVHTESPDASVKPTIDFGYYTHPLDLEVHARHIQALENLAATPSISKCIKKGGTRWPRREGSLTLDQAKEIIKGYSMTNYHPCGTCSMMPEDIGGVVNSRLRVYGTKNVRVVDASIMPIIPRGNIITTVYAVAEKAADIISEDLGIKRTT